MRRVPGGGRSLRRGRRWRGRSSGQPPLNPAATGADVAAERVVRTPEALEALAGRSDDEALTALLQGLDGPDPRVRLAAIEGLRGNQREEAVTALSTVVGSHPLEDAVRAAGLAALIELDDPFLLERVGSAIAHREGDAPLGESDRETLQAILSIEDLAESAPELAWQLAPALKDGRRESRARARELLSWLGAASLEPLLEALEHLEVRREAASLLGELGHERAIGPLAGMVFDYDVEVRRTVVSALGGFRDPRSAEALRRSVEDLDPSVREAASVALERMGPARDLVAAAGVTTKLVDLHSHILPGLDDGPEALDGSLLLARAAAEAGTTVIAATPHVRSDFPYELDRIGPGVAELTAGLADAGIPLEIVAAGEVAVTKLLELDEATLRLLGFGNGPYILVESPYNDSGELVERALHDAQVMGLRPLLAHPERSPCFLGDIDRLARLSKRGVIFSITAGSMEGRFGRTVRDFTVRLFEEGLVHDVASDAHNTNGRPPDLLRGFRAMEEHLPGVLDQAEWFAYEVPSAILAGEGLPARPGPLGRGARRSRWRGGRS